MSASTIVTSGIPSVGRSAAASAATQSIAELGVASLLGAGCVQQEILTPPMIKSLSKHHKVCFEIWLEQKSTCCAVAGHNTMLYNDTDDGRCTA
eukprot:9971861-Ditylum_brightwellii.AAC.1